MSFFTRILAFLTALFSMVFSWIMPHESTPDFEIILEANATTGYSWVCEVEDEKVAANIGNEYIPTYNVDLVGTGGTQHFYFKALAEGETKVTFTYLQNWAGGNVGQQVVYSVHINADKSETITQIK